MWFTHPDGIQWMIFYYGAMHNLSIFCYMTLLWISCNQQYIGPLCNSLCLWFSCAQPYCCHSKQWWQSLASLLAACMSVSPYKSRSAYNRTGSKKIFTSKLIAWDFLYIYLVWGDRDRFLCSGPGKPLENPPEQLHCELHSHHAPLRWILVGMSCFCAYLPTRSGHSSRSTLPLHKSEKYYNT